MKNLTKLLCLLAVIILIQFHPAASSAQVITVTGKIFDSDKNPITGASILLSCDGRYLGGTHSMEDGSFVVQYESSGGEYCMLNIAARGYSFIISEIAVEDSTIYMEYDLDKIPPRMAESGINNGGNECMDSAPPAGLAERRHC